MINIRQIDETIEELLEHGTTKKEAEELALLYIVRDHLSDVEPRDSGYSFAADDDSTPFIAAAKKVPTPALISIMDEHMKCVEIMFPKEYDAVLERLKSFS